MIWVNNAPGGYGWHGRALVNGECCCADCIVERSDGLLMLGLPRHPDQEVLKDMKDRGYVGLYRAITKPWKIKSWKSKSMSK